MGYIHRRPRSKKSNRHCLWCGSMLQPDVWKVLMISDRYYQRFLCERDHFLWLHFLRPHLFSWVLLTHSGVWLSLPWSTVANTRQLPCRSDLGGGWYVYTTDLLFIGLLYSPSHFPITVCTASGYVLEASLVITLSNQINKFILIAFRCEHPYFKTFPAVYLICA